VVDLSPFSETVAIESLVSERKRILREREVRDIMPKEKTRLATAVKKPC
jgi:hypothetical protein